MGLSAPSYSFHNCNFKQRKEPHVLDICFNIRKIILLPSAMIIQLKQKRLKSSKSAHDQGLSLCSDLFLYDQIEFMLDHIAYFGKTPTIMGKGNLCKHITFFKSISAY